MANLPNESAPIKTADEMLTFAQAMEVFNIKKADLLTAIRDHGICFHYVYATDTLWFDKNQLSYAFNQVPVE